jgi:hypothetical protein
MPSLRLLLAFTLALLAGGLTPRRSIAQDTTSQALRVYLDCNDFQGCDFDFFRTEITAVNWVRDRQVADIHVLVTTQTTGSGGRQYTSTFIGLGRFTGITDTLTYSSPPAAPQDEVRRGLAQVFRAGFVRYVARTTAASTLKISFGEEKNAGGPGSQTTAKNDRWNYWVFRNSVNGYQQGEASYSSRYVSFNVSANRTTAAWKTNVSLNDSYNESSYELSAGEKFTNIQRNYGASLLQVMSMGEHWSAGLRASLTSSTYENQKLAYRLSPAVEYDLFPYSQSTRRQIRVEYNLGVQHVRYNDTTIFDKLRETLPSHQLSVSAAAREPWGSVDIGVNGTNYLHDRTKYSLSTFSSASLRLFKGFSVNVFGDYSKFNDQFFLPKRSFTDEQILTRQFARETHYRYFVNFGISYTFGSIFNNVVNPRFGGSGGGMIFME